jgi:uncharacterized membrane protein YhdT
MKNNLLNRIAGLVVYTALGLIAGALIGKAGVYAGLPDWFEAEAALAGTGIGAIVYAVRIARVKG